MRSPAVRLTERINSADRSGTRGKKPLLHLTLNNDAKRLKNSKTTISGSNEKKPVQRESLLKKIYIKRGRI